MTNADFRAAEVIKRLVGIQYPSIAEIGVYSGEMSRRLLYRLNLHLLMVDTWGHTDSASYLASGDPMAHKTPEEWAEIMGKALDAVSWAADRVRIFHGSAEDAAEFHEDDRFDLVFLDAAHDYENVCNDIAKWWPRVADNGYLGGHDYGRPEFGVTEAVDEFCEEHGYALELGQNYCWFVRKC